jgi:hypothetical protein
MWALYVHSNTVGNAKSQRCDDWDASNGQSGLKTVTPLLRRVTSIKAEPGDPEPNRVTGPRRAAFPFVTIFLGNRQTRPEGCCSEKSRPRQVEGPPPFEGNATVLSLVHKRPCPRQSLVARGLSSRGCHPRRRSWPQRQPRVQSISPH